MDIAVALARWQFAVTTVYHFFFVPITLGLSILIAIMQTAYYRTNNEMYKKMVKFWGKLFLINFAIGVATGIVQEFQFGMNWSEYSRTVGDIFGAPLAIEALLAFFMESTFLGIWVFGWEKLPKGIHLASIWLVALGANLSAVWILIANSFMQEPVGYVIRNGRAEMTDFWAVVFNPHIFVQWPHVFAASITMAGFLVMGVSAYHLRRKGKHHKLFTESFKFAAIYAVIGTILVVVNGHAQAQHMVATQPMKMAAAEALWESEGPAGESVFAITDEAGRRNIVDIKVPGVLSVLAHNNFTDPVRGINDIQAEYEQTYGPGNYIPPVIFSYWLFRIMVGLGFLMVAMAALALYLVVNDKIDRAGWFLRLLIPAIFLPTLAISTGWIFTEIARQPWAVFGVLKVSDGVSLAVSPAELWISLIGYIVLYSALIVADWQLMVKYAKKGPEEETASISAASATAQA